MDLEEEIFVSSSAQQAVKKSKRLGTSSFKKPTQPRQSQIAAATRGPSKVVDEECSWFDDMLSNAGFEFGLKSEPNKLKFDQGVFQRNLSQALKKSSSNLVVDDFAKEFEKRIENRTLLKKCLQATSTADSCQSARSRAQDSLARILLGVHDIQTKIATVLLEKATELAYDDQVEGAGSVALSSLILVQFRWIKILDEAFAAKIVEVLPALPLNFQKELILQIPEFLSFSAHNEISRKLCELLMEKQELCIVIVETLSCLDVKADVFEEVKQIVLKSVQSASPHELPVLLNFLLQDLDNLEAFQIVSELRATIDLCVPVSTSTPRYTQMKSGDPGKVFDGLVLECILKHCTQQKSVWEAWVKAIEKVPSSSDHKPLDILVLIGLYKNKKCTKYVESTFREKVKKGHFNSRLIQKTFTSHPCVLNEKFDSVRSLGQGFLKSFDPVLVDFGSTIYVNAFLSMEKYCKRDVVFGLINLVSYGSIPIQNAGLDTLSRLVEKDPSSLAEYYNFLNYLLDRLERISLIQVRKVYFILSRLAYQGGTEGSNLQDDLLLTITKQVVHHELNFQKIGIIGSLMAVKEMSGTKDIEKSSLNATTLLSLNSITSRRSSRINSDNDLLQKAKSMLKVIIDRSEMKPEMEGLFWDEISRAIQMGDFSEKLEDFIDSNISTSFEDQYVVDYNADLKECLGIEVEVMFPLETLNEDSIVLNLTALILRDDQISKGEWKSNAKGTFADLKSSAVTLSSNFRLLRICTFFRVGGNLDDIDALLICGIIMPKSFSMNESDIKTLSVDKKNILCISTFHCLNWFREVVNSFASLTESDNRSKVIERIGNIVELQKKLGKLLFYYPEFKPPRANFDLNDPAQYPTPSTSNTSKNSGASKTQRGSKRKLDSNEKENRSQTKKTQEVPGTFAPPTAIATPVASNDVEINNEALDVSRFRPFFRELDLTTFVLLECGMKLPANTDSSSPSEIGAVEEPKLKPEHLDFLLDDLLLKLMHILPETSGKRLSALKVVNSNQEAGFSNLHLYTPHDVASCMVNMIPSFCSLLEDCNGYFQFIKDQTEASIDGDEGLESEDTTCVSKCMLHLLKILNALLSWNGFHEIENVDLLNLAILKIGSRSMANPSSKSTSAENTRHCFGYLSKFEASLPTTDCALALVSLLETVAKHSQDHLHQVQVSEMAELFLQRTWKSATDARDKGSKNNLKIQKLLDAYFTYSPDVLKSLEFLISSTIQNMIESEEKNASSADFPTLDKVSFSTFYASLFKYLLRYIQDVEVFKPKHPESGHLILAKWNPTSMILNKLVTLVKTFNSRINIKTCLVNSKKYLELFLRFCIPLLEAEFKSNTKEVIGFLKIIQQSTRFLQSCCYHAKKNLQDPNLSKHVPAMKKCFDMVLCNMKAILAANNCQNAFWIGVLKTKDLYGKEVSDEESEKEEVEETVASDLEKDSEVDASDSEVY